MLVNQLTRPMRIASAFALFCLMNSCLLLVAGCATKPKTAGPKPVVAPRVVGEVAVVDEEKQFVLIDLESNLYVPPPGTEMRATNASGETARLKASPEQKRPFIAADIVSGEPAVGDRVIK